MRRPNITLNEALRRNNNNADLFRLIASISVIWGHAYGLAPADGIREPIGAALGFDYSGSLAVKFFFFLSGMLIATSWMRDESPLKFSIARLFRIFPGLIVSSAVCLLILGPLLTALPLHQYFANSWMYEHIVFDSYLGYEIPGVFQHNAVTTGNGAIWTIAYELLMYAILLGLGMCGLFRFKWGAAAVYGASIVWFMARPDSISAFGLLDNNDAGRLPAFFAFGVLLALVKDSIRIDGRLVIGLCLLAYLLRHGPAFEYAFYPAFLLAPIWLMTTQAVRSIKLPGDFSYGIYVYGWPAQQTVASLLPHSGPYTNQIIAIPLAILAGVLSWYLVEKPFIGLGHRLPTLFVDMRGSALAKR
ncbi:acyltransferase family protein [Burkholderia sp. Ac-20379]|uniref:acyltransferase family protein n=1 Tax=Burkholderia sp. Ac-20379 TaxID=2703900 RepID=UPI00197F5BB7|nr:acyltransferase [Burkholderia sp. Ac-20379]MBN3726977.1 acyltransferase [Burkholderia sp. Ac-20379]